MALLIVAHHRMRAFQERKIVATYSPRMAAPAIQRPVRTP
jgi:hypothetical protein